MTYIFHIIFMIKDVFKQGLGCERERVHVIIDSDAFVFIMLACTVLLSFHAPLINSASLNTLPNLSEKGE